MAYKISDMEKVIDKFLQLDVNDEDRVIKEELVEACRNDGVDEKAIQECLKHADVDDNGKISLDEFCHGLGLQSKDMRVERSERRFERMGVVPGVDPSIKLIATSMSQEKQNVITTKYLELMEKASGKPENVDNVARELKTFLDEKYGRAWQVIIMMGSYWMYFSHMPLLALQFKHGAYIGLIWRTPTA